MYGNAGMRRKSVFAEAYNPEEDDGIDDMKVIFTIRAIFRGRHFYSAHFTLLLNFMFNSWTLVVIKSYRLTLDLFFVNSL